MKIKFYNISEDTITAKTMLAPWDYDIKTDTSEVMVLDIHPSCVNEALFIDLDEANINYEIMSAEAVAFESSLKALRDSIAKISASIETSFVSSTACTDALKSLSKALSKGVEDCGE